MKLRRKLLLLLALTRAAGLTAAEPAPAEAAPAAQTAYRVTGYEVTGSGALGSNEIAQVFHDAIGPAVSLSQIRRGLIRLQESYRERGFANATVTLPRQALDSGRIIVQVNEGRPASTTSIPAVAPAPAPLLGVRQFEVRGNTQLSDAELNAVLARVLTETPLTQEQLQQALARLRQVYYDRGFTGASVTVPSQVLTDGNVVIEVHEGTSSKSLVTSPAANEPPVKAPERTFAVRSYEVLGNTLLQPETIQQAFTNGIGTNVTLRQIQQSLGELQLAYRGRGYATVSVGLPQQQISNGVVKVQVTEGTLSGINITGNRHYSAGNILRALPSLTTSVLLNSKWFQPELDRANSSQDRQIYPVLGPGPDPGTTVLELKVKDRLPLHGHIELNNKATPGTPPLRIETALQYNNVWQREHQAGIQYNFSPQEMKSDSQWPKFFDQPKVASYSGFYRVPLSLNGGLREEYDRLPVDFGYDQVTRTFRLPAPTGNPDFILYGSRSTSETPVRSGPVTVITNTVLADISSRFDQRDLSETENIGAKFTLPLREFAGVRSSVIFGADFKHYDSSTYSTNLTFFKLYALDEFGNRELVREETIPFGSSSRIQLDYVPLSAGWSALRPDKGGSTSLSINQNFFFSALASDRKKFQSVAGSTEAGGDYTTITAALVRDQKLPKDWSLQFRANGQWASAALIGNEQLALGGTGGVRGYEEGESYGDSGWRTMLDLKAPALGIGSFPRAVGEVPVHLRCSWFMDYGELYRLDRPGPAGDSVQQWGTGLGFYATAGQHFDARLTLGWALLETPSTPMGSARAYFSVGAQF